MEKVATFSNGKIRITNDKIVVTFQEKKNSKLKNFKVNQEIIREIYWIKQTNTAALKRYHLVLSGFFIVLLFSIGAYQILQVMDSGLLNNFPILSNILFWFTLAYFIVGLVCIGLMFAIEIFDDTVFIATKFYSLLRSRKVNYVCLKSPRKERLIPVRNRMEAEKMIDFINEHSTIN